MSSHAVLWHQGMFLRPHHFQASDRYWHEQMHLSSQWDVNYNWGIQSIEINLDALQNYRFEVRRLQCRHRDGTLVRVPQDGVISSIDFREALARQNPLEMVLAVPALQPTRSNLGGPEDITIRYRAEIPREGIVDENTGQNAWQNSSSNLTSGCSPAWMILQAMKLFPLLASSGRPRRKRCLSCMIRSSRHCSVVMAGSHCR